MWLGGSLGARKRDRENGMDRRWTDCVCEGVGASVRVRQQSAAAAAFFRNLIHTDLRNGGRKRRSSSDMK